MYQISNEKFGLFVTELRKEKNLTQKDLAEKLYVSDKTVSKWERGLSMPNVVLLIPIADIAYASSRSCWASSDKPFIFCSSPETLIYRATRTSAGAISLFLIISPQFLSISFNFPSCRDNIISADGMLYLV